MSPILSACCTAIVAIPIWLEAIDQVRVVEAPGRVPNHDDPDCPRSHPVDDAKATHEALADVVPVRDREDTA
jgi:hypothetical protein